MKKNEKFIYYVVHSNTVQNKENVVAEFDSVFIKKAVKSRSSFVIWIPKDEAEYLGIDENVFLRIGLKKLKPLEAKRKRGG